MWKTFDAFGARVRLTTVSEGLLVGVALAGYLPVVVLAFTVEPMRRWPLWVSLAAVAGYAVLAGVAVAHELRARRRLAAAAEEAFTQHFEPQRRSLRADPDADLRLDAGALGFLAGDQRAALLASVTWLRAAGSIGPHPRAADVHTAVGDPPAEMDALTSALFAAAGEHPFGATWRPAGFDLAALHDSQPARPPKVFEVLDRLRDELQAAGLWDRVDLPGWFPGPRSRTATAALVGLLGTPIAIALTLDDGMLPALAVLLAQAVVLLKGNAYPRTTYRGPTPSGEQALAQARARCSDLDPANPTSAAGTPQPRRLAIAVAIFGAEALAGHDDELRSIVAAGGFHQTFTEQGDGMDPGL